MKVGLRPLFLFLGLYATLCCGTRFGNVVDSSEERGDATATSHLRFELVIEGYFMIMKSFTNELGLDVS